MTSLQNEPISRSTLADRAFDYLSEAILHGELRPGDRLIEDELSARLGISRAPIREALAELERQGLAYSRARRGTFVRSWTKKDLWEVAVLRATLESLAAQLAAAHVTPDDIAYLEQAITEMVEAEREGDMGRLIDLDFKFHGRIEQLCNHDRLMLLIRNMQIQVRIFRLATLRTDSDTYPEEHRVVLDAIRTGDPKMAHDRTYDHVMQSAELVLAALPDEGIVALPTPSSQSSPAE